MAGAVAPDRIPPDSAAPEMAVALEGALTYEAGILSGRLNAPHEISVYADGEMIWRGLAVPRAGHAVDEAAPKTSEYVFAVTVPDPDGEDIISTRFLRVLAEGIGELPGSPLDAPYGDHLLGYVELINTTPESVQVGGWLIDKRWPWEPVPLSVWYDGECLQTAFTGVSRSDLGVTGYDAPNGGFFVAIAKPAGFDHRKLQILPGRASCPLALTEDASLPSDPQPTIAMPAAAAQPSPRETLADHVEAYIDHVSSEGVVSGWARSDAHRGPVEVELWLAGERAAAATACAFRRDLLEAGVGHGHYGFNCRIRSSGALQGILELRVRGTSATISQFTIPAALISDGQPEPQTVESLLTRPDLWSMEDVERNLEALALEDNLSVFGPRRYVSRVYRFLLGRWPDPPEFDFYPNDISQGVISATDIFRIVAESDECKRSLVTPLPPFDPKFPFLPSNRLRHPPR